MLTNLINKIGLDKIAHFSLGGLICAIITVIFIVSTGKTNYICLLYPIIGSIIVYVISWIKEEFLDTEYSMMDIAAAMLGCLLVFLSVASSLVINYYFK